MKRLKKKKTITANNHSQKKSKSQYEIPVKITRVLNHYKSCPNVASNDFLNCVYGAVFGFVIGDIVGAHVAHQHHHSEKEIQAALLMLGCGNYNLGPAQGTDETEMFLTSSYGLIEGGQ